MARLAAVASRIARDSRFQLFIILVIVANGILVGVETSPELTTSYGGVFTLLNDAILAIFVFELAVRLIAYWPRPLAFFREPWNVFDFVIVALSLLPAAGSFATVARLARLLRVVRLVSVLPDLRLIVGTLLRSVSSMGPVVLLLSLLLYVYAVLGFHLFHELDPENWGSLAVAMMTLFKTSPWRAGWRSRTRSSRPAGSSGSTSGASSLIAVFMVVNLFIAVVLNNLEQVRDEHRAEDAEALADSVAAEEAKIPARPLPDPAADLGFPTSEGVHDRELLAGSRSSAAASIVRTGHAGFRPDLTDRGAGARDAGAAVRRTERADIAQTCGTGIDRPDRRFVSSERMAVEGVRRGRSEAAQGTMFVTRELHRRERVRPCGSTARSCSLRSVPANDDSRPRRGHDPTRSHQDATAVPPITYRAVSVR